MFALKPWRTDLLAGLLIGGRASAIFSVIAALLPTVFVRGTSELQLRSNVVAIPIFSLSKQQELQGECRSTIDSWTRAAASDLMFVSEQ